MASEMSVFTRSPTPADEGVAPLRDRLSPVRRTCLAPALIAPALSRRSDRAGQAGDKSTRKAPTSPRRL